MLKLHILVVLVLCAVSLAHGQVVDNIINKLIGPAWSCASEAGCYQGKCWTWCGAFARQWCYTTASGSNGGPEAYCEDNSDCDRCWKCHSPCGWQ